MIELFTGTVGGGKSYSALLEGIDHAARGGAVIANFPITSRKQKILEQWIWIENIDTDELKRLSIEKGWYGNEGACKIILDECADLFSSREGLDKETKAKRKKDLSFFRHSRKFGYDIILIAQQARMIDRQLRDLAQHEQKHYNAKAFWWLKWLPLKLHIRVRKWYNMPMRGQVSFFFITKKYYKQYDTMRIFNPLEMATELEEAYIDRDMPDRVRSFVADLKERAQDGVGAPSSTVCI